MATGARETDEKLDAAYATALKDAWKIVPSEPYTSLPVLGDLVAKQAKDVETLVGKLLPQDMYAWCAKMPTDARTHVQKGLASKPPKKYMPASCCTKCTVNGLRHCLGLQPTRSMPMPRPPPSLKAASGGERTKGATHLALMPSRRSRQTWPRMPVC